MGQAKLFKCKCGWSGDGSQLKKQASVTHGDEWWECPECGGNGPGFLKIEEEVKRDCDRKCNQCPLVTHGNSRLLSLILNRAFNKFGEEMYNIVQSACPNLTVCRECCIDDFTHVEGCGIAKKAEGQ